MQYVQVVSSPGMYGDLASEQFVQTARQGGVCIAQSVKLPPGDLSRESADRVVQVSEVKTQVIHVWINRDPPLMDRQAFGQNVKPVFFEFPFESPVLGDRKLGQDPTIGCFEQQTVPNRSVNDCGGVWDKKF